MSTADPAITEEQDAEFSVVAYERALVEKGEVAENERVREHVDLLRARYDAKRSRLDLDRDRLLWIRLTGKVEALGEVLKWLRGEA